MERGKRPLVRKFPESAERSPVTGDRPPLYLAGRELPCSSKVSNIQLSGSQAGIDIAYNVLRQA